MWPEKDYQEPPNNFLRKLWLGVRDSFKSNKRVSRHPKKIAQQLEHTIGTIVMINLGLLPAARLL